ncbi:MAG: cyclodeaminase/cyclohydrolase family protein [Caldisericia bacterium]
MEERTIKKYLEELSSPLPTPGGGSVGDISLSFSAALAAMVCGLTEGLQGYIEELSNFKDQFLNLSYEDEKAFDLVMEAYKLPKNSEEEKKLRRQKIDDSLKIATLTPLKSIKLAKELIPYLNILIVQGNKNAISDIGVAILNLYSGTLSSYLNVMINLKSIKDKTFVESVRSEVEDLKENIIKWCNENLKKILNEMTI